MSNESARLLHKKDYYNRMLPFLDDVRRYSKGPLVNGKGRWQPQNIKSYMGHSNVLKHIETKNNLIRNLNGNTKHSLRNREERTNLPNFEKTNKNDTHKCSTETEDDEDIIEGMSSKFDNNLHQCLSATIMHSTLPIFEVLQPLATSSTHSLFYENSYYLDGIGYGYRSLHKLHKDHEKLKFDYMKFLKSISKRNKPSDGDIIFGNAKVISTNAHAWGNSRIDWLLNLEHKQELRRKQMLLRSTNKLKHRQ